MMKRECIIDEKEDNNDITMITGDVISTPKSFIGAESTDPPPIAVEEVFQFWKLQKFWVT